MPGSSQSSDNGTRPDDPIDVTRRTVLSGAAGTAALALGAGGVAANGKGGEGFVPVDDFKDETSEIVDGPFETPNQRESFRCQDRGFAISFPYWTFQYEGEREIRKLYTRDNQIDTSATYRWTAQDKVCSDDSGEYRQIGFVAVN